MPNLKTQTIMKRVFKQSKVNAFVGTAASTSLFSFAILFIALCAGCSDSTKDEAAQANIHFDKSKWNLRQDGNYSYRKLMVNDILHSYHWAGVSRDSVIQMLGKPNDVEEGNLIYTYDQEPFLGGLGTSIESIVFELAPDSTVRLARFNDGGWD
jgi:hypothetical protein